MPLYRHVRRLLGKTGVVHECRKCGKNLEPRAECCGVCGSSDVVRYDIE